MAHVEQQLCWRGQLQVDLDEQLLDRWHEEAEEGRRHHQGNSAGRGHDEDRGPQAPRCKDLVRNLDPDSR